VTWWWRRREGEGEAWSALTGTGDGLARSGTSPCASRRVLGVLGAYGAVGVVLVSCVGVYHLVQGSGEKGCDMVGRQGVDQRWFGHVCVSCTYGMTWWCNILLK
jgi:hypothetical protein